MPGSVSIAFKGAASADDAFFARTPAAWRQLASVVGLPPTHCEVAAEC